MAATNGDKRSLEERMQEICSRTGYSYEVSSGQRKYGGPPPDWPEGQEMPPVGSEIYCGRIPQFIEEDQLIPLFEQCGTIYDVRMMVDPGAHQHRGFCFCLFTTKEAAKEAVKQLDGYEISPKKALKVNVSIPNVRLYIGNIPKNRDRDELFEAISQVTDGLKDVIVYTMADDPKKKNRGFAFLDYDSHKSASNARKRFLNGRARIFNCDIFAEWADQQVEPDDSVMATVKVLYVRNIQRDVTEEVLKEKFGEFGEIEKVKKIKDYGFVHFVNREDALQAMENLNGATINSSEISVSLAKPVDPKAKEQRKQQHTGGGGAGHLWPPPRPDTGKKAFSGLPMRGRGGLRGMMMGGGLRGAMRGGMRGFMKPKPLFGGGLAFRGLTADFGEEEYYDDSYYDESYGDESYYDDYSQGYEDYSSLGGTSFGKGLGLAGAPRGRGARGAAGGIPSLAAAARGGAGPRGMGRGGAMRAAMGATALRARAAVRGRGAAAARGTRGGGGLRGAIAAKRAAGGGIPGMSAAAKRLKMMEASGDGWSTGPIAQQPLGGAGAAATGWEDQESWYQDSFDQGQQWG